MTISSAGLKEVDLGCLSRTTSSLSTVERSAVNSSAVRASDSSSRARDAVLFSARSAMSGSLTRVMWSGHFQLHIPIMRYSLEACKSIPPQQGVVSAAERSHLEGDFFGPVILRRAEYNVECDFSRTSRLPTRDNSYEGRAALLNAAPIYFHFVECIFVDEVKSDSTIHEHFGKSKAVHNCV